MPSPHNLQVRMGELKSSHPALDTGDPDRLQDSKIQKPYTNSDIVLSWKHHINMEEQVERLVNKVWGT
jgi:hypothetical protein